MAGSVDMHTLLIGSFLVSFIFDIIYGSQGVKAAWSSRLRLITWVSTFLCSGWHSMPSCNSAKESSASWHPSH